MAAGAATTRDNNGALLPRDVLWDVLLRLPAADLCRLRLVCRSWRSITSDPTFAKAHSSRHLLVAGLHAVAAGNGDGCRREVQIVDLSGNVIRRISTGQTWDNSRNLSAYLDLLCVSQGYGETCVINPSAGGDAVAVLPVDYNDIDKSRGSSRTTFSIVGQVPSTGKYKVLRIHRCSGGGEPEQNCHIVTLDGDGSCGGRPWRVVPSQPPMRVSASPMHTSVVRGVAYFLPLHQANHTAANNVVVGKPDDIASFDLLTEEWRLTPHRGPISGGEQQMATNPCLLTKLNGCLVTACNTREFGEFSMDLWFSVDIDKGSWTKQYSLHCAPMSHEGGFVYPLMVLDDERILIWESWKRVLRAYDPRISEWTDLATIPKYCSLVMYQGSLLCSGLWE